MKIRQERVELVWVAAGASLWGVDTILRRPLTSNLSSIQIVLMEHLILLAPLLLALLVWRDAWWKLRLVQWGAICGIAWGGSALGSICYTEAVRIGNPTSAVLLQKTQPLIATVLAWMVLREPLGRRFWLRLLLAMVGAYLVSFGFGVPDTSVSGAAASFALAAASLWAASTVLGRFVLRGVSFPVLTALRIVVAAPLLAILSRLRSPNWIPALSGHDLSFLVLMALVPGLLALLIYYRGLTHTRASLAAVAELCFPATATVLNWAVLGVRISPAQVMGFVLIWAVILTWQRHSA